MQGRKKIKKVQTYRCASLDVENALPHTWAMGAHYTERVQAVFLPTAHLADHRAPLRKGKIEKRKGKEGKREKKRRKKERNREKGKERVYFRVYNHCASLKA